MPRSAGGRPRRSAAITRVAVLQAMGPGSTPSRGAGRVRRGGLARRSPGYPPSSPAPSARTVTASLRFRPPWAGALERGQAKRDRPLARGGFGFHPRGSIAALLMPSCGHQRHPAAREVTQPPTHNGCSRPGSTVRHLPSSRAAPCASPRRRDNRSADLIGASSLTSSARTTMKPAIGRTRVALTGGLGG